MKGSLPLEPTEEGQENSIFREYSTASAAPALAKGALLDRDPLQYQRTKCQRHGRSRHDGAGHHRQANEFTDDRDVVRVTKRTVGTAMNERCTRNDDHAKRPGGTEGEDGPPLQRLRRREHGSAGDNDRQAWEAAQHPFRDHGEKRSGVCHLHQAIDVPRRLDPAASALDGLVPRGSERFGPKEGSNHEGEEDQPQSPARRTIARPIPGAADRTKPPSRTAEGELTMARSARLNRHFPANVRRRSTANPA